MMKHVEYDIYMHYFFYHNTIYIMENCNQCKLALYCRIRNQNESTF